MSEIAPDLLTQRQWLRHYDAGVPATLATSARTLPQLLRDIMPPADDLIAFCREHLARPTAHRLIEFREELSKSLIGKPLRRMLVVAEQRTLEAQQS